MMFEEWTVDEMLEQMKVFYSVHKKMSEQPELFTKEELDLIGYYGDAFNDELADNGVEL